MPLIVISFYNTPSADDYDFSAPVKRTWEETGSVLQAVRTVGETVADYYMNWQGNYAATFLGILQPALLGERFYFLSTLLLLAGLMASVFYFFRVIFHQVLGAHSSDTADFTACVTLILCIQLTPGPVQSFFWWDGSVAYTGFFALSLWLIGGVLTFLARDHCSPIRLAGLVALALFVGGGNYITALLMCELLALLTVYAFVKKKASRFFLLGVWIASAVGLALNVLAPGGANRQTFYETLSLSKSLALSFATAGEDACRWTGPLNLIGLALLAPFFWRLPENPRFHKPWVFLASFALGFCLFASTYEPAFFAMGSAGEPRIANIRFFFWTLLCVLWLYIGIQTVKAMLARCNPEKADLDGVLRRMFYRYGKSFLALLGIAAVLGAVRLFDQQQTLSSASAVVSLLKGKAHAYQEVNLKRLEILRGSEKNVVLPAYTDPPFVLFVGEDIQEDPQHWRNQGLARYYGKDSVVVEAQK